MVVGLKTLVILGIMIFSLSALSIVVRDVNASSYGIYKNVPPSAIERLKALNHARALAQGNLTDDFVTQYTNARMPSYSVQASMSSSPPVLVEILTGVVMASIAVVALYLTFKDRRTHVHERDEILVH